jgi:hypothetical protein
MADYVLPAVVENRVRYFDGQFLQDQDFIDEQDYQLDREHRINRLLHGPGVADGLAVTSATANQVTVTPGTAIDADGWQLVLAQATPVSLTAADFNNKQGVQLYISYLASAENPQTPSGSDDTRWLERPQLTALAPGTQWTGTASPVLLATLAVDGSGRVTIDSSVRSYSGVLLPGPGADPAALQASSAGGVSIGGPLTVSAPPSGSPFTALEIDAQSFVKGSNLTASYYLNMRDVGAGGGGNYRLCVRGDGNVGINTGTPGARLEIVGAGGLNVDLLVNGRIRSNSNDGGLWVSQDRFIGGFSNFIGLYNNNAWRLAVAQNGNVGIGTGTAAPGARLEVAGAGGLNVDLLVNGRIRSNSNDGGLWVSQDRFIGGFSNFIGLYNNNVWRLAVAANGYVGIGTGIGQPVAPLQVVAPASGSPFTAVQIDVQSFVNGPNLTASYFLNMRDVGAGGGGNYRFCVRGDGNVGIGTGSPGAKLCVNGSTWLQGDLFVDGRISMLVGPNHWMNFFPKSTIDGQQWGALSDTSGPSDARLKTGLRPVRGALDLVSRLRAVRYRWGEEGLDYLTRDVADAASGGPGATDAEHRRAVAEEVRRARAALDGDRVGLVAQDVEAVLPELVHEVNGYKHIRYQQLTALLASAVTELSVEVAELRAAAAGAQS